MLFQSILSEMLYFVSCLHVIKKVEEIPICFSSGMFFFTDASQIFVATF